MGAYVINLDEYKSIGTHWIALYVKYVNVNNNAIYFDSFGVEHIQQNKVRTFYRKFIEYKHAIQFCADTFVLDLLILLDYTSLLDYTNFFSSNDH